MSIETPAKRQRTSDTAARSPNKSPRRTLSAEQQRSLRHAHYLHNGISVTEQLASLRGGTSDLGQIAWSYHNVLATASDTQGSVSTSAAGGHVVIQYPVSSSSKRPLRPSYLYPEQPIFASAPTAEPSQPRQGTAATSTTPSTHYGDPKHISFSPCGYYLCAYFPLSDPVLAAKQSSTSASPGAPAAAPPSGIAPGALPSQAIGAPMLPQLSGGAQPVDPSIPVSQEASASASSAKPVDSPTAKLCIWSRAETGALNDWKLVQAVPVKPTSHRNWSAAASAKPNNVLKVNESGQQIIREGSRASPSDRDRAKDAGCLRGGVKQVVWLNRRRRIVLGSPSSSSGHYGASPCRRLAARGPSFLPTASASADDAGPDHDVALMVFGHHGQVALLSSRKVDRDAASNGVAISTTDSAASPFFNSILHSSLYTPNLQPSPVTLDSASNLGDRQPGSEATYASPFSASKIEGHSPEHDVDQEAALTHLAIGMPANDSVLLVASKRPSSTSSLIDLTEITIDLRGELVTMITRPLQPASLASFDGSASSEGQENGAEDLDTEARWGGRGKLSILTWAEVDATGSDEDAQAGKSASLRLLACSSHLETPSGTSDSIDQDDTSPTMHSSIAAWDLCKAENELSDAFASLECRKTGHAPKWHDWQLRHVQTKVLPGRLVTSMVTNAHGLAVADLALMTALVPAAGKQGLLAEQLSYFDLKRVDMAEGEASSIPVRALSRVADPVVSSNGALIAAYSNLANGASPRSVVLWKMPPYPPTYRPQQSSDVAKPVTTTVEEARLRMSQLLALSCLRKSDASDISRALGASANEEAGGKLLIEIGDLLKITDSKRQDVLVKIEGATQKGPSHDSNSIPFHQALRLLKIRMAIGDGPASAAADTKSSVRLERLILELGLCYQVLRLARVKTEVTVTPPPPAAEGKKKSGAAAKNAAAASNANANVSETRVRVYYRLVSVWPLLAQLQWFLTLLDGISKLALATSALSDAAKAETEAQTGQAAGTGSNSFEQDFVRMLNKPTPRRLVLQIVAHFCDFQEWILSTTKKENLPPATGTSVGDEAMAFFASAGEAGADGRVLAVSEQMALARDALRLVGGDASIDLADFAQLLAKLEADSVAAGATNGSGPNASREADRFWWASLDGGKPEHVGAEGSVKSDQDAAAALQTKLLSSIVDPESGALVDVLTLFVSPSDISDERNVLYEKSTSDDDLASKQLGASERDESALLKALSAMSAKRSGDDVRRDIVRKVSLRSAVTQSAILNDGATLLRNNPTAAAVQRLQPPFQPNAAGAGTTSDAESEGSTVKLALMRAKRCVRCGALSQDAVTATYSVSPPSPAPGNGMVIDPSLPPQVQMQMQMQMQMMQMQYQMQQQQQQQNGGVPQGGMPFMPMPMVQPPPKLVGIQVAAQSAGAGAPFRYNCLCGGSWWAL